MWTNKSSSRSHCYKCHFKKTNIKCNVRDVKCGKLKFVSRASCRKCGTDKRDNIRINSIHNNNDERGNDIHNNMSSMNGLEVNDINNTNINKSNVIKHEDKGKCVICLERNADTVIVICKHLSI